MIIFESSLLLSVLIVKYGKFLVVMLQLKFKNERIDDRLGKFKEVDAPPKKSFSEEEFDRLFALKVTFV